MAEQDRSAYRIAEYSALMAKLERAAQDLHVAEVTFGIGIALFYAWVIKDGASVAATGRWSLLIPVALAVIAAARIWARFAYIASIEAYTRDVEVEMFGDVAPYGWERRYSDNTTGFYKTLRIGTWIVAIVITALLYLFLPLPHP